MSLRNLDTPAEKEARRLIAQAHQKELGVHLTRLDADFAAWRSGTLTAAALADRVRTFSDGPARSLHRRYVEDNPLNALAQAVLAGAIQQADVPEEMREEVAVAVSVLKLKR